MEDKIFNSWLAGFWEGEGSLYKLTKQTGYGVNIHQAIDNEKTVRFCMDKIKEKFGGHLNKKAPRILKHKIQLRWQLYKREDIIYFLKTIYPYCKIRKKQIEDVLEYYEIHPKRINQYAKYTQNISTDTYNR